MKMKNLIVPVAIAAAIGLAACESEIDNKTAAAVSEPTATDAAAHSPGVQVAVIQDQSRIEFVGAKVTRDHHGGFNDFDGSVTFVDGVPSSITFTIEMASVFTDTERLTNHLKTDDFFDVETYPTATFESTSIATTPEGTADATHVITGTLDMHGVTKQVSFPATVVMTEDGIAATAEFTINRQDWNIAYKGKPDDLVRDDVLIKLDLHFPPAPEATAEGESTAGETKTAE